MIRTSEAKPNGIAERALAARASLGIPIDVVRLDGGTQSRALLQESVIEEYATAIQGGAEFPPIVVFYDGSDHWLADGFHRLRAYAAAGLETIPADVRQGTRRDAILYSVGANEAHGLRRTNDDKRRAVLTLLNDGEWAKWSDREIARQCVVDHKTVSNLRGKHLGNSPDGRTVERNGTTYTMNTTAIGKAAPKEDAMFEAETEETATVASLRRGNKLVLLDGMSVEDVARQGMAREAVGESAEAIAKSLQISAVYYRAACDVVYLFDRGNYSKADEPIVERAFRMLGDQKVMEAREAVDPVAVKVWGTGTKAPRVHREPARLEQFDQSLGIIIQTCTTTDEVSIPYLNAEQAKKAIRQIGKARSALRRFAERIKEIHE